MMQELRKKVRGSLISDRLSVEYVKRISLLNSEGKKVQRAFEIEKETSLRRDKELLQLRGQRVELEVWMILI